MTKPDKIIIEEIKQLIEGRGQIALQAYKQYEPIVANTIASKTQDINKISYTLDFMLDFCFDDKMLLLYRKLCRYLYDIDQEACLFYVNAYCETWDEEEEHFGDNKKVQK